MATTCLRSTLLFCRSVKTTGALHHVLNHPQVNSPCVVAIHQTLVVRHGSFYNRKDADNLWDSVTGVSNQGKKKGRASRGKLFRRVNLNKGWRIGDGKTGLVFPGLNQMFTGKENVKDLGIRRQVEERKFKRETDDSSKIQKRKMMKRRDPLDRGYTGRKIEGRKIPPPSPAGDYNFSDFDTYIIETKMTGHVTASKGKIVSFSVTTAVGNRKGLIGLATGKASNMNAAVNSAKNKAVKHLMYVDLFDNYAPLHNFTEKYHRTTVIVKQAARGQGLHCHHALKILCELIGIKDIYIKSEGNVRNYLNLCRAFLTGMQKTRTHQEIADDLGHHIVQYRAETDNYPFVVGSPSEDAKPTDFKKQDGFSFESYCYGNRLPLNKPGKKPYYWQFEMYKKKQAKEYKRRNQPKARLQRLVLGHQSNWQRYKHE